MYEVIGEQKQKEVLSSHGIGVAPAGVQNPENERGPKFMYSPMVPVDSLECFNGKNKEWATQEDYTLPVIPSVIT